MVSGQTVLKEYHALVSLALSPDFSNINLHYFMCTLMQPGAYDGLLIQSKLLRTIGEIIGKTQSNTKHAR